MLRKLRGKVGRANSSFRFRTCRLPVVTRHWQNPAMKIPTLLITILFAILIAAPSFAQTSGESPAAATSSAAAPERPAEPAGDDEANDGDV